MRFHPFWQFKPTFTKTMSSGFAAVKLNETEREIFQLLRDCVKDANLPVTLRVAGGWVRDKLLGLECHDLDIAIDKMMGQPFAERLISYLKAKGVSASSCGVIHSNPDRSKHLETATLAIHGQLIDFVNLRAETYANDSRIPNSIAFGTPLEDALRRDITINSMFWNIHTESVEDFTGHGLDDLHNGVVRTPLAPRETLLDDPLRLLRVIRFATRFQYSIVPELLESMQDSVVHQSLRDKVSRERVGIELDKIVLDRYGLQGLFLINQVGVFSQIFDCPVACENRPAEPSKEQIHALLNAFGKFIYYNSGWTQAQLRLALLACGMLPFAGLRYQIKQKHVQPSSTLKEDFLVHCIVRDALKFPNRDIVALGALLNHVNRAESFLFDGQRDAVIIGRLLKDLGVEWRLALHLAALRRFWRDGAVAEEEVKLREYQAKLSDALLYIDGIGLTEAWSMKPLLTGQEIQSILGIKAGQQVGQALSGLLDWQFRNPSASKDDAIAFLLPPK